MRYVCTVENGRTIPTTARRILVPVDFSETSAAALEYAVDLAARAGASVDVLHIWDLPNYPAMGEFVDEDGERESFVQHVHDLAMNRLNELISEHRRDGVDVVGVLESGEPIKVIPRIASQFDLVVMGAHDDDGAKGLFFGNVADRVAGEVHCPVVTVRREENAPTSPRMRASIPSRV
jgi:nucleotide-binding universal stress UspA family protein